MDKALHIIKRAPLPSHCYGPREEGTTIDTILLHFISDVRDTPDNPYDIDRVQAIFARLGVASHYVIDRDGLVHQFVDESLKAYHAGKGQLDTRPEVYNCLNEYSIGIELMGMGTADEMAFVLHDHEYTALAAAHPEWIGFTPAQYDALNALLPEICARHNIPRTRASILQHADYSPHKPDLGTLFDWTKVGL